MDKKEEIRLFYAGELKEDYSFKYLTRTEVALMGLMMDTGNSKENTEMLMDLLPDDKKKQELVDFLIETKNNKDSFSADEFRKRFMEITLG